MPDWPDDDDESGRYDDHADDDEWGGPYEISGEPDGFVSLEDEAEDDDE